MTGQFILFLDFTIFCSGTNSVLQISIGRDSKKHCKRKKKQKPEDLHVHYRINCFLSFKSYFIYYFNFSNVSNLPQSGFLGFFPNYYLHFYFSITKKWYALAIHVMQLYGSA